MFLSIIIFLGKICLKEFYKVPWVWPELPINATIFILSVFSVDRFYKLYLVTIVSKLWHFITYHHVASSNVVGSYSSMKQMIFKSMFTKSTSPYLDWGTMLFISLSLARVSFFKLDISLGSFVSSSTFSYSWGTSSLTWSSISHN